MSLLSGFLPVRPSSCHVCGFQTELNAQFVSHMSLHVDREQWMFSLCCSICDYVCVEESDMKSHVSAGHAGETAALVMPSSLGSVFPFSRTISRFPFVYNLCFSVSLSPSLPQFISLVHYFTLSLSLSLSLPVSRCLSLSVSRAPSSSITSLSHILARGLVAPPVSCLIKSFCLYLQSDPLRPGGLAWGRPAISCPSLI